VAKARKKVPGVHVGQGGEILYLGKLSTGCRACKAGEWDCVFVTMACNLDCRFCWRPNLAGPQHLGSALSPTREGIAASYRKSRISGISFSGGEPFAKAAGLFDWLSWFKARYPGRYYWVYTNGLLVTKKHLVRLAKLGLDEIRFNMAASGYTHPVAMRNLREAARRIPHVTVEIPAIPEDIDELLPAINLWSDAGVSYLNLHELVYEPGTNSAHMRGDRKSGSLDDGHRFDYNPRSRAVTLAVMEKVARERLPIGVNDCSLQSKAHQLRGRRRMLAPLVKESYEKFSGNDLLESCCIRTGREVLFFHPDRLDKMRRRYPAGQFMRLTRKVPLGFNAGGQWVRCEIIGRGKQKTPTGNR